MNGAVSAARAKPAPGMETGALVSALRLSFLRIAAVKREGGLKESGCSRQLILQGKQCSDRKIAMPFCKGGLFVKP
jgi:hypothetical protein